MNIEMQSLFFNTNLRCLSPNAFLKCDMPSNLNLFCHLSYFISMKMTVKSIFSYAKLSSYMDLQTELDFMDFIK